MDLIKRPSSHFEEREGGVKPSILVLHYTETIGMKDAEDYFLARKPHPSGGRVSAHYMVDEDGTVVQYVDESKRAWHAGASYWDGVSDVNSHSIGIEIVNPGHRFGYRAFPMKQMMAVVTLCQEIIKRNPAITPMRVVGHSDVAPGRKIDPGELFDWRMLSGRGVGVIPVPIKSDFTESASWVTDNDKLRAALTAYGYDPKASLRENIAAFQRHFHQEIFKTPAKVGQPEKDMAARLHALLRMKQKSGPKP